MSALRVVGLVSGGKDSIYNLLRCIASGHNVVALANIEPESSAGDDLDSYMYQTVGHEAIHLIGEATGIPLFRQKTLGKAKHSGLSYRETESDEVEDLYTLLSNVKKEVDFQAVATGAIASDYQRTRVENVCSRLGVHSLAYLWRQDQATLLSSMIRANVDAVVVKVASLGLRPDKHLGMPISLLQSDVTKSNSRFGANICGEGGEYETLVLDCPLFHSKIVLDKTEIVSERASDDASPGYLRINSAHLEPKFGANQSPTQTLDERIKKIRSVLEDPSSFVEENLPSFSSQVPPRVFERLTSPAQPLTASQIPCTTSYNSETGWYFVSNVHASNMTMALSNLKDALSKKSMELDDVVFVSIWCKNMDDFATINKEYSEGMRPSAPARACVSVPLSADTPVLLEAVAHSKKVDYRDIVHVESLSHWAPANIGPYSQSVKTAGAIFVAGQIPMVPSNLAIWDASLEKQTRLSIRHIERVLAVSGATLKNVVQASVYVTSYNEVERICDLVRVCLGSQAVVTGVIVEDMPKKSQVEIQVVASMEEPLRSGVQETKIYGSLSCKTERSITDPVKAVSGQVSLKDSSIGISSTDLETVLSQCVQLMESESRSEFLRLFYVVNFPGLNRALEEATKNIKCAYSLVPVHACETSSTFLSIVGLSM